MDRVTCKTCPYYDADVQVLLYDPAITYISPRTATGGCRLEPHTTPHKTPDEWCSHHPRMSEWVGQPGMYLKGD